MIQSNRPGGGGLRPWYSSPARAFDAAHHALPLVLLARAFGAAAALRRRPAVACSRRGGGGLRPRPAAAARRGLLRPCDITFRRSRSSPLTTCEKQRGIQEFDRVQNHSSLTSHLRPSCGGGLRPRGVEVVDRDRVTKPFVAAAWRPRGGRAPGSSATSKVSSLTLLRRPLPLPRPCAAAARRQRRRFGFCLFVF